MTAAKQKYSLVIKRTRPMRIEELELRRIRNWMDNGSAHLFEMDSAGIARNTLIHFHDKGFLDFDHQSGIVSMTAEGRKYLQEKLQRRIEFAKKVGWLIIERGIPLVLDIVARSI